MRQSNENENPEDAVRKQTNNKSILTQTEDQSQVDNHGDETESRHEEFIVLDEIDRFTEMEGGIKESKSEISNLWSYLDILLEMISEDKAESKVKVFLQLCYQLRHHRHLCFLTHPQDYLRRQ